MSDLTHDIKQLIALGECPCKSGAWSHWDETLGKAVERIGELEAETRRVRSERDRAMAITRGAMAHFIGPAHREQGTEGNDDD